MKVFIVAGGSGGHVFPAVALAQDLKARGKVNFLFITSSRKKDKDFLKKKNIPFSALPLIGFQNFNPFYVISFLFRLILGSIKSCYLLLQYSPSLVIGFGGYVTGPIIILAALLGKRTIIHEQNVYPGKTNRILAAFVDKIAVSFPEAKDYLRKYEDKIIVSGNPLRAEFKKQSINKEGFTILAVGGSQGSHRLNKFVPEAIGILKHELKRELDVIHITGDKERDKVETSYRKRGIRSRIYAFTDDIVDLYNESDFVIARAGAMTVSELLYLSKPCILIPYPHADGHQSLNARLIENIGLGFVIEEERLTVDRLKDTIKTLLDKELLQSMSANVKDRYKNEACGILAKELLYEQ